jgi:HSP20 family protein
MSTTLTKEPAETKSYFEVSRPFSIFEEMDRMFEKLEKRAFNLFRERGAYDGLAMNDWFQAEAQLFKSTPVEIEEKEKELVVRVEVPGFQAKELSVRAEPQNVTVYGKVENKTEPDDKSKRHYSEFSGREAFRSIWLPVTVNADNATATLDKGVLTITLSKVAPPRLVEVKAAS